MPGLYLHIPFCKQACTYCDFHFSTNTKGREEMVLAMRTEIERRAAELGTEALGSIYFGGGTPSALSAEQLKELLDEVRGVTVVQPAAEITIEANPDDITEDVLGQWKGIGITRVSLGTQSLRDDRLKWMGRVHDAQQALRSIDLISKAGFDSWTIDLIYGLPEMTIAEWNEQLSIALDHGMPHLSAYCLTIEKRTALHHQVETGLVRPSNDEAQAEQFDRLTARMEDAGLIHYEISNFGKDGHFAVHNSNYWRGVPYVGIGPSAHSFNGRTRRWNVSNNARYVAAIEKGERYWEEESLTHEQRVNERLMTGLRTMWGVDLGALGDDVLGREASTVKKYIDSGDLLVQADRLLLTPKGRRFADRIASDLFIATSPEQKKPT